MTGTLLARIEQILTPIDIAVHQHLQKLLPSTDTDTDLVLWYLVPFGIIVASMLVGDVLHERRMAFDEDILDREDFGAQKEVTPPIAGNLRRFASKAELIEAKAQERHALLLARAAAIGASRHRVSDLAIERDVAAHQVYYVPDRGQRGTALPAGISAWYIKDFGYCPA